MFYSLFFKVLVVFVCDLELDIFFCCVEIYKWVWFWRYCMVFCVVVVFDKRILLFCLFFDEVVKKICELMVDSENMDVLYESYDVFKRE